MMYLNPHYHLLIPDGYTRRRISASVAERLATNRVLPDVPGYLTQYAENTYLAVGLTEGGAVKVNWRRAVPIIHHLSHSSRVAHSRPALSPLRELVIRFTAALQRVKTGKPGPPSVFPSRCALL